MTTRRMGRRAATGLLGAAALGLRPRRAQAANEVVFASFGGAVEQFFRKTLMPQFEQETGIKVTYVVGTAMSLYSRVLATRNRPEVDIYWANDLLHIAGKQAGVYAPLDAKAIPNLDKLVDGARQPGEMGVMSQIASTGLQYNTEKFRQAGWQPPTSWMDLWDPKFKGKVALYSINILYSQELLALMARLSGGSEANIAPGLKKIKELKDMGNVSAVAGTPAEMDNILAQGQAWITYNGCNRGLSAKLSGAPLDFVNPKEGAIQYNLFLNPIKGGPNPGPAMTFINFLIRADIQAKIAENIFYGPVNRDTKLSPQAAAVLPYGPAALKALVQLNREVMNRELDNWLDQWNRVIDAK